MTGKVGLYLFMASWNMFAEGLVDTEDASNGYSLHGKTQWRSGRQIVPSFQAIVRLGYR